MKLYLLITLFFIGFEVCNAQDSLSTSEPVALKKEKKKNGESKDTTTKQINHPKIAASRSAIFPGLGQIYNKKYWKLPLVYGGLGVTGYIFFDNIKTYKEYKFAYAARISAQAPMPDSTGYNQLKNIYKILSPGSIRTARDEFRRYIDYSVLVFLILWGLNVVDASVDAHLKSFDVSPDLSLQIKPGHSDLAKTNGLSLVLKIGK